MNFLDFLLASYRLASLSFLVYMWERKKKRITVSDTKWSSSKFCFSLFAISVFKLRFSYIFLVRSVDMTVQRSTTVSKHSKQTQGIKTVGKHI